MIKHTFVVLAYNESDKLEDCIKSVLNQKYKSHVVIATSTLNDYIKNIAKKYNLKILINKVKKGIGYDFDFASNCIKSELITIAHQDDIYEYDYSEQIVNNYLKYPNATILFTDYYEIKSGKKVYTNKNLKIKRFLLLLLNFHFISGFKFIKKSSIRFGNAICCPAVTFVTKNVPKEKFKSDMKCDIDWLAWEKLSNVKGKFIYISKKLMGHRIDENTTTTKIISEGIRTKEDLEMLKKFWPEKIAKMINKFYKKAEDNNL